MTRCPTRTRATDDYNMYSLSLTLRGDRAMFWFEHRNVSPAAFAHAGMTSLEDGNMSGWGAASTLTANGTGLLPTDATLDEDLRCCQKPPERLVSCRYHGRRVGDITYPCPAGRRGARAPRVVTTTEDLVRDVDAERIRVGLSCAVPGRGGAPPGVEADHDTVRVPVQM